MLVSSPLFHRQLLYLGSTIVGIPTQLHRKGLHVQHILRYLLIIHVARRAGSQARVCVAAAALATRGGRTDVDHLVLMEAFAENGSSDVVAGAHRGGSVLRWQALSEAGDADDPARRFVAECSLK